MAPHSLDDARSDESSAEPGGHSEKLGKELCSTRRGFLQASATLGAVALGFSCISRAHAQVPAAQAKPKELSGGKFPAAPAKAKSRVLGANDRILVAHIGLGGMGGTHLHLFKEHEAARNTGSIAVCDVYRPRLEEKTGLARRGQSGSVQAEADYRKILENKDVDAVVIATPEHWHCQIAAHALEAGKHVYVEKPLARYLDEAFQLYDTWKRTGGVVQVGSHGCSDPKYRAAREGVAKLGPLVSVQSSYTRNAGTAGEWNYYIDESASSANLDWKLWLGSAPKRPWNEDARARFFRYRKYRDYSAGILGDLMPHRIHPLLLALGGEDWPTRVHCIGTMRISTDREVADTVTVTAEMDKGYTMLFMGSTVNEQGLPEMVRGHQATLYLGGGEPDLRPERPYAEELDASRISVVDSGENHLKHQNDWLACIRENKQPSCDLGLALRAQALVSLAEISEISGRTVLFNPKTRQHRYA